MRTLFQGIRCKLRVLLQSSAVTVVAALVVGLGIGANTSVFGQVNSLVRHPRHFPVLLSAATANRVVSAGNHANSNRVFGDITAAVDLARVNLTGAGEPEELFAGEVAANFFHMIGVQPLLGRTFLPEEDKYGHDRVAILSHGLWRRRFSGDTGVIGRSIVLNGENHQVIGILPRDFSWNNRRADVWVPYLLASNRDQQIAGARCLRVASRRHPRARARSGEI